MRGCVRACFVPFAVLSGIPLRCVLCACASACCACPYVCVYVYVSMFVFAGALRVMDRGTGNEEDPGGYHAAFDVWAARLMKLVGKRGEADELAPPVFKVIQAVRRTVGEWNVHPVPRGYTLASMVTSRSVSVKGYDFEV